MRDEARRERYSINDSEAKQYAIFAIYFNAIDLLHVPGDHDEPGHYLIVEIRNRNESANERKAVFN